MSVRARIAPVDQCVLEGRLYEFIPFLRDEPYPLDQEEMIWRAQEHGVNCDEEDTERLLRHESELRHVAVPIVVSVEDPEHILYIREDDLGFLHARRSQPACYWGSIVWLVRRQVHGRKQHLQKRGR